MDKNKNVIEHIKGICDTQKSKYILTKSTVDTLVYFCFGITLDDKCEDILNVIIDKAYRDATNMGAFNTKNKGVDISDKKTNGTRKIIDFITKGEFGSVEHEKICKDIKDEFKDTNNFTIGNAQKWVNMSLKYIYLLSQFSEGYSEFNCSFKNIANCVKDNSSNLNVPIDSYIIDALVFSDIDGLGVDNEKHKRYKRPSDHIEKWSKIDAC